MKTALLIIDVQSGMFDHEPRADQADAVIARLNQLAAAARAERRWCGFNTNAPARR